MAIYIDPPQWPAHGTTFSHMVSDHSYLELHRKAAEIGLPARAFDADHYDVAAKLYDAAVRAGAREVSGGELIRILRSSGLRVPMRERPERLRPILREAWATLCPEDLKLGEELIERWEERHRRYHDLAHLQHCLASMEKLAQAADLPGIPTEARLAAWFHDAVYNGVAGEDEERSAQLAEEHLPGELGREVARLVRLTAKHEVDDGDGVGALLVDADLAILAEPWPRYFRYVQQVRDEYSHVSDADWATGRPQVLVHFLKRDSIYVSEAAKGMWEKSARNNIERELSIPNSRRLKV